MFVYCVCGRTAQSSHDFNNQLTLHKYKKSYNIQAEFLHAYEKTSNQEEDRICCMHFKDHAIQSNPIQSSD